MRNITVGKLIEQLKQEDPNRIVILAVSEGNGYAPMREASRYRWLEGELFEDAPELTPELEAQGFDASDFNSKAKPAVILFPR